MTWLVTENKRTAKDKSEKQLNTGEYRMEKPYIPHAANYSPETQIAAAPKSICNISSAIRPEYYKSGKIEAIDIIEQFDLGFHLGNAVKYILRAGKKDGNAVKQDLTKAAWYIERYIDFLEDEEHGDCE